MASSSLGTHTVTSHGRGRKGHWTQHSLLWGESPSKFGSNLLKIGPKSLKSQVQVVPSSKADRGCSEYVHGPNKEKEAGVRKKTAWWRDSIFLFWLNQRGWDKRDSNRRNLFLPKSVQFSPHHKFP